MKLEKWKTTVLGVGPWIVSDTDGLINTIGTFREEEYADLFIQALEATLAMKANLKDDRAL